MYGAFADPVRAACHSTIPLEIPMTDKLDTHNKSEVKVSELEQ